MKRTLAIATCLALCSTASSDTKEHEQHFNDRLVGAELAGRFVRLYHRTRFLEGTAKDRSQLAALRKRLTVVRGMPVEDLVAYMETEDWFERQLLTRLQDIGSYGIRFQKGQGGTVEAWRRMLRDLLAIEVDARSFSTTTSIGGAGDFYYSHLHTALHNAILALGDDSGMLPEHLSDHDLTWIFQEIDSLGRALTKERMDFLRSIKTPAVARAVDALTLGMDDIRMARDLPTMRSTVDGAWRVMGKLRGLSLVGGALAWGRVPDLLEGM